MVEPDVERPEPAHRVADQCPLRCARVCVIVSIDVANQIPRHEVFPIARRGRVGVEAGAERIVGVRHGDGDDRPLRPQGPAQAGHAQNDRENQTEPKAAATGTRPEPYRGSSHRRRSGSANHGVGAGAIMTSTMESVVRVAIAVAALHFAPCAARAQRPIEPQTIVRDWKAVNRHATVVDSGGRKFVRLDEGPSMGLVWTPLDFTDGEIELDVHGRDVLQKSFLGVAFHIESNTAFDAVYLRPFNFRATDSTRHAHAIQYISQPAYPWDRLRSQRSGQFEQPVLPEPDPNAWVHLKVVVRGNGVAAFVNGAASPALQVQGLSGRTKGGVGLWVGDPSPGDFANLVVRRVK